jgi:hypothetical protein
MWASRRSALFSPPTSHWKRGLVCPKLRASNEGLHRPRVARAQGAAKPLLLLLLRPPYNVFFLG